MLSSRGRVCSRKCWAFSSVVEKPVQNAPARPAGSWPKRHGLILGSRGSKLALVQTTQLQESLCKSFPELGRAGGIRIKTLETAGDRDKAKDMRSLGPGAFTDEIDQAVLKQEVDIAVHSLKDTPVKLLPGLHLAACLPRADHRDVFISMKAKTIGDLPKGAVVGTASMRRRAQLLHKHPHLQVATVRGNLDERLQAVMRGELDGIVLAMAGLQRLDLLQHATSVLDPEEMVPAACQGAVGLVCRKDDEAAMRYLSTINHMPTYLEVTCERAWLSAVLADAPVLPSFAVACNATYVHEAMRMRLVGRVANTDGTKLRSMCVEAPAGAPAVALQFGRMCGQEMRASGQLAAIVPL